MLRWLATEYGLVYLTLDDIEPDRQLLSLFPARILLKEELLPLRRLNGTPEEVLDNPDLLQLMLPILRADFEVCQTYSYTSEPPLGYPIWALGGMQDKDVPFDHLKAWRDQTAGQFELLMFPGDHFFLHSSQSLLLRTISGELQRLAQGAGRNQRPGATPL